jgi:hypothetical protein
VIFALRHRRNWQSQNNQASALSTAGEYIPATRPGMTGWFGVRRYI